MDLSNLNAPTTSMRVPSERPDDLNINVNEESQDQPDEIVVIRSLNQQNEIE
jgi:hypothetical protein